MVLLFFSPVASVDFQLPLNTRLFVLNWSFMMKRRYFLFIRKLQSMFLSLFLLLVSLFLLPRHTLYSSPPPCFLRPFSLPGAPFLPYSCLKVCPFFSAIFRGP